MYRNRLEIEGKVVKEPTLNETRNGVPLCKFVICHRDSKDKSKVSFYKIVARGRLATWCFDSLVYKDAVVLVEGRLNQYQIDINGVRENRIEVFANFIRVLERRDTRNSTRSYDWVEEEVDNCGYDPSDDAPEIWS